MSLGALEVIRPGLLTTIQDLGRYGHQAVGVPVAGPMDGFSHRLANHLVGNDPAAATLEITLIGPELLIEVDTTMAIAASARTKRSPTAFTSPPRGLITRPRTPRSEIRTFEPPPSMVTGAPAARAT